MPRTREQDLEANRQYQRTWYAKNKKVQAERVQKNNDRYLKERREWLVSYFEEHPCTDCGNPDIRVLEFDHISEDKAHNVTKMIRGLHSWEKILLEISKCEVVCANCHRIRTYQRMKNCWRNGAEVKG